MNDLQKAVKLSLIFGFGAAVLIPVCYEIYANVMPQIAFVILGAGSLAASAKFARLEKLRDSFLGITAYIAFGTILGLVGYIIIHPFVSNWLGRVSEYFYLGLAEQVKYWVKAVEIMAAAYIICILKAVFKAVKSKINQNGEAAAKYVEDAFDDSKMQ